MKNLSVYLFLILFTLHIPSQADDIRDFQIEGMSIGDSLLDYLSEEKILKELELGKDEYAWTDKKFGDVYIYEATETYQYLSASIKRKDKKYIIYAVRGLIDIEDINVCLKKRNKISDDFENIFINAKKSEKKFKSSSDPTGESLGHAIYFIFDSGDEIEVTCYEFGKTMTSPNGLDVILATKEHIDWLKKFSKY